MDMNKEPATFNLVDRPWIPVLRTNGRPTRLGIRQALTEAGSIRGLAASNPIDDVAILRYLVTVLAWCRPVVSAEELLEVASPGGVPNDWLGGLGAPSQPNPLFDLLAAPRGHLQAPPDRHHLTKEERKRRTRPVADLFHEVPGGTNIAHLRHVVDFEHGVCLPCLAIGLVRLPTTITAYGSGKSPGINGTPPVYFTPIGRSLAATIALNIPTERIPGDCPCWAPTYGGDARGRVGFLEGASWTSRQFRIDGGSPGQCSQCGASAAPLLRGLLETNAPNGRPGLTSAPLESWRDPHVAYSKKRLPIRGLAADGNLLGGSRHWRDWLGAMQGVHDASPPLAVTQATRFPDALSRVDATAMITNKAKSVECVRISYPPSVVVGSNESTARLAVLLKTLADEKQSELKPPPCKTLPAAIGSSLAAETPNIEAFSYASAVQTARSLPSHASEALAVALNRVARSTTPPDLLDLLEAQRRSLAAAGPPTSQSVKERSTASGRGRRRDRPS